jgi:hypothetical protein
MSLWTDSLTVAGLACLTFGTGAQAWAFRAEFNVLSDAFAMERQADADGGRAETLTAVTKLAATASAAFVVGPSALLLPPVSAALSLTVPLLFPVNLAWSLFRWPAYARRIREKGGEDAVELARLMRQAGVWVILCGGSLLVLAGAVLTLAHDA